MEWFLANSPMVFERAGQHLVLALVPMVLGLLISIPLAQFSRRHSALRQLVATVSSLLYTIPSLALFIILPPLLGTRILDPLNVIVALTIYVGNEPDMDAIVAKALTVGALDAFAIDARRDFIDDYVFPALQAGAIYEGVYPLATALSRPLMAKLLVDVARREGGREKALGRR